MRNAFRPQTIMEISSAMEQAREDGDVGVIILTGEGPLAFCSGGDQRVRGDDGYITEPGSGVGRFHITDLHVQIRRLPKPVVAMVAGYAVGGGHVLHLVCDLTIAADNARFGQTGPASAPGTAASAPRCCATSSGRSAPRRFGCCAASTTRSRRSTWGSSTRSSRSTASRRRPSSWCREMLALSPFALRLVKSCFNAHEDGYTGIQQLAHDANLLFYASDEAREGREAYKEKRVPDFSKFRKRS